VQLVLLCGRRVAEIEVDFTGSSPQVHGWLNASRASTIARLAAARAIKLHGIRDVARTQKAPPSPLPS
jgi:N-methylhydantoinase B/oxoprolinase/acetone carboxylase alpha subunit